MRAEFYQKIMPIGILKKVGEYDMPDDALSYRFSVRQEATIGHMEDILITPNKALYDTIEYFRTRTITGNIFIATVYPKVK